MDYHFNSDNVYFIFGVLGSSSSSGVQCRSSYYIAYFSKEFSIWFIIIYPFAKEPTTRMNLCYWLKSCLRIYYTFFVGFFDTLFQLLNRFSIWTNSLIMDGLFFEIYIFSFFIICFEINTIKKFYEVILEINCFTR